MKKLDARLLFGVFTGGFFGVPADRDDMPDDAIAASDDPNTAMAIFGDATKHCRELGFTASAASAMKMLEAEFDAGSKGYRLGDRRRLWKEYQGRLLDELKGSVVLLIEPGKVPYFTTTHPFGETVAQRFPTTIVDIEEAGKCLALDRSTACVFHLMRVLEVALQEFGTKMGLTQADAKNWQTLLNKVGEKIKQLPNSTREEKEYLGKCQAAREHLQAVKDAWRNDVMHPLATHTPEQAVDIWNHTGALMRKLAEFV